MLIQRWKSIGEIMNDGEALDIYGIGEGSGVVMVEKQIELEER